MGCPERALSCAVAQVLSRAWLGRDAEAEAVIVASQSNANSAGVWLSFSNTEPERIGKAKIEEPEETRQERESISCK